MSPVLSTALTGLMSPALTTQLGGVCRGTPACMCCVPFCDGCGFGLFGGWCWLLFVCLGRVTPPVLLPLQDFRPLFCVLVRHGERLFARCCLPSPGLGDGTVPCVRCNQCRGPVPVSGHVFPPRLASAVGCGSCSAAGVSRRWLFCWVVAVDSIRVVSLCRRFLGVVVGGVV